jgi:hypothetical protein
VNYTSSNWDINSILHFLVHTGYLTYKVSPTDSKRGQVSIPNQELLDHWKTEVIPLAKSFVIGLNPQYPERIKNCLIGFNVIDIEAIMREMLLYCSFHDIASAKNKSKNSYHMFFYGCFFAVLNDRNNVTVSSNKEAGHGRYDVRIEFRNIRKAIVFEFKKSNEIDKLEEDAKKGLYQCKERHYVADLPDYQCLLIGVSFFKKEMSPLSTLVQDCQRMN